MIFGLIALVVMLIGTVAVVRSLNTAMFTSGNYAFKRDLVNQAERAMATVLTSVRDAGPLATEAARQANDSARNYSAVALPTNAQGIPTALLTAAAFGVVGVATNDIVVADMGVTVRYVIDRLCTVLGAPTAASCTLAPTQLPAGGSSGELLNAMDSSGGGAGAVQTQVIYRVSVRVDGPRGTQSFFQSTFKL
jgi:Tfp pilus assembly protein PilX